MLLTNTVVLAFIVAVSSAQSLVSYATTCWPQTVYSSACRLYTFSGSPNGVTEYTNPGSGSSAWSQSPANTITGTPATATNGATAATNTYKYAPYLNGVSLEVMVFYWTSDWELQYASYKLTGGWSTQSITTSEWEDADTYPLSAMQARTWLTGTTANPVIVSAVFFLQATTDDATIYYFLRVGATGSWTGPFTFAVASAVSYDFTVGIQTDSNGFATSVDGYFDSEQHYATTDVTGLTGATAAADLVLPRGLIGVTGDYLMGGALRIYKTFGGHGQLCETTPAVNVFPDYNFTSTLPATVFSGGASSTIKSEIYQASTSAPLNLNIFSLQSDHTGIKSNMWNSANGWMPTVIIPL